MSEIPGLHLVPEKYRGIVLLGAFLAPYFPYVTRAYHAVANQGGLKGILGAILFGTNTPKKNDDQK